MKTRGKNFISTHIVWATSLTLIVLVICFTIVFISIHPFTIRFEADDNVEKIMNNVRQIYNSNNESKDIYPFKANDEILKISPLCPIGTEASEVTCECAKNTRTPCMAFCYECVNISKR